MLMLSLEKQFHLQTLLSEVNKLKSLEQAKDLLRQLLYHHLLYEQQVVEVLKMKIESDCGTMFYSQADQDDEEHSY